ncbi:hypothetical protein SISSUDRAFT_1048515 [Sistotremastrum suecicum HHB10207 ss-3]|uniref:Uncharacterized protein n=1 Tax=Sistotremastrum suecicum HHB10207 ss-3 TaxID=1314776 RepID=A0A166CG03_9AGAM|nr:hypothetical protein SISSUDRAFT_1048515 [Sistotremastrum suecicum HHB10207 ss-3]
MPVLKLSWTVLLLVLVSCLCTLHFAQMGGRSPKFIICNKRENHLLGLEREGVLDDDFQSGRQICLSHCSSNSVDFCCLWFCSAHPISLWRC